MKSLTTKDLKNFLAAQTSPCVSIYMQEPSAASLHGQLREAEALLLKDYGTKICEQILSPIKEHARKMLWDNSSRKPCVIFFSPSAAGLLELPKVTKNLVVVADSFHIKPILHWLQREKPYYFLTLNQRRGVLYEGGSSGLRQIFTLCSEPIEPDLRVKKKSRLEHASKESLGRFFRQIDKKISPLIGSRRVPLLIGASSYHQALFASLCSQPFLCEEYLEGNFISANSHELHKQTQIIMSRIVDHYEALQVEEFWQATNENLATDRLHDIARHAALGSIRRLFIAENQHVWGHYDRKRGSLRIHEAQKNAHDDDVLDDIAEVVLAKGGDVVVLPIENMPAEAHAAAILRWREPQLPRQGIAIAI